MCRTSNPEADLGLLQHPRLERFVITVNGWKPLTIIIKRSILDVAVVLDPPLKSPFTTMTFGEKLSRVTKNIKGKGPYVSKYAVQQLNSDKLIIRKQRYIRS